MKTVIITEKQKKKLKKAIAAQDQVGNKVNAGLMDAIAYGGMCESRYNQIQTWYRGYKKKFGEKSDTTPHLLWLTDDLEYASEYGNAVTVYKIDMSKCNGTVYEIDDMGIDYIDGPSEEEAQELLKQGINSYCFYANQDSSYCMCLWSEEPILSKEPLNINENVNKDTITLYHGVNRKGLEFNIEQGGFVPRVCSEGGPKAVWLSEKQYNYEFTFAFDFPKSLVEQLSNVDYIYTNKIGFNEFGCRLVKTSINTCLKEHDIYVETNIANDKLSKIQFRYFPDLGMELWKGFKDYPNVLDKYINPYIEKYQQLGEEKERINESWEDLEDIFEEHGCYDLLSEFDYDIKHNIKQKKWNLIPAQQYHTLLQRFMENPTMARIPYNIVHDWFTNIIVPNAIDIESITNLAGHSAYFPVDDVSDYFDAENVVDYETGSEYLESLGFYDWCKLPDGSDGWSDYGLQPLFKIINEYTPNASAEDILILINRCLDVAHQRGDLSSAFIEGGKYSCDYISGNIKENKKKVVKNDKGEVVPEKCDKCGGKVVVQLHGEPVYVCKDCGKYFGTVPFNLNENTENEVTSDDVDLSSFNIKKKLNPRFWQDGHLDSRIRLKLLDIAEDFIDYLDVDWVKPKDIIMTGSLANFNWDGKYSDIDLHIVIDYSDIDDNIDLVTDYCMSKKTLWNNDHTNLNIYGFPVEVYVEDCNTKEDSTRAIYSLDRDTWIIEPEREILANSKVNKTYIKNKVSDYMNQIDKLVYLYKKNKKSDYKIGKISEKAEKLWDEIKDMRKKGFKKSNGKEISNENIIFKSLRRNNYLDKLYKLKTKTYDILNSL